MRKSFTEVFINTKIIVNDTSNRVLIKTCNEAKSENEQHLIYWFMFDTGFDFQKTNYHNQVVALVNRDYTEPISTKKLGLFKTLGNSLKPN